MVFTSFVALFDIGFIGFKVNSGQVPDMMCHGQAHAIIGQFCEIIQMGRFVMLCLVGMLFFW